jgi:sulfide:quinone oxidoreductase
MVVSDSEDYWFVPSNPWVAVRWREADAIRVPLAAGHGQGASALPAWARARAPAENRLDLADGTSLAYDYLVIATGPDLAFDEIRPWPGWSHGVGVPHRPCRPCRRPVRCLLPKSAPIVVGAAQGASCFGPAYEFALILDTELRRRKIRDAVPMTFVTSEPYRPSGPGRRGRHQGLLESEMRERHIKWVTNARVTA